MSLQSRITDVITAIGQDIKTLFGRSVPAGGATGQVLSKQSGADHDLTWTTPGTVPLTLVNLAVNTAVMYEAEVGVSDAAALTTHTVVCYLKPNADWDMDDLSEIGVSASVQSNGVISFYITRPGPIVGTFSVAYALE